MALNENLCDEAFQERTGAVASLFKSEFIELGPAWPPLPPWPWGGQMGPRPQAPAPRVPSRLRVPHPGVGPASSRPSPRPSLQTQPPQACLPGDLCWEGQPAHRAPRRCRSSRRRSSPCDQLSATLQDREAPPRNHVQSGSRKGLWT